MPDTSIDTETWDQLGLGPQDPTVDKAAPEPGALTVLDTAGSSPPAARVPAKAFDQYGSNMNASLSSQPAVVPLRVSGAAPSPAQTSPGLHGSDARCVLDDPPLRTPQSGRRNSGGSGHAPKKTAGRKPSANQAVLSLSSPVAPSPAGDL
ncbi:hypothetical protein ACQJBY_043119 [Aegilops geniculata]